MRKNGDFLTADDMKSADGALSEYRAYINGWIAMAAQRMGRFDVAVPAYRHLQTFAHPVLGGFTTAAPYGEGESGVDVLMTAHLGLASLYGGDLVQGRKAGDLLARFLAVQPDLREGIYLRMGHGGGLVREFPAERSIFYRVATSQPQQAYFMIGYPIGFLGELYQATGEEAHLLTARRYLEFAFSCHGLRQFHFSHKVAWGAAVLYDLTGERRYANLAMDIADYLVNIQHDAGAWLQDQPVHTSFDQTAEIAIWLTEIRRLLGSLT
jgi:hypothetical protein